MNPRIITILLGSVILSLGLVGLLFPQFTMDRILGFAVAPSHAANAVLGEVRATYGGLFVVMGLFTLFGALEPRANRARLQMIGFLWIGAALGRLVGAYIDGDPGVMGWVGVAFEGVIGLGLFAVPYLDGGSSSPHPVPVPAPVPAPPPVTSAPDEPQG